MIRSRHSVLLALVALLVALAAGWLSACGGSGGAAAAPASAAPDPVVLYVNDHAVHRSAVDAVRAEFRLGGSPDSVARAEKEAVRRELVREEAARLGVKADPAEVAARRRNMVTQFGGDQALSAALKQVPMTDAQLVSDLGDGVLRQAVQDALFKRLTATSAAAHAYYATHRSEFTRPATVHVWGILVPAEAIAESAIGRLRSGHPFSEVARQFSTDPEAKDQGGDMGVVALSSLPAPMRKAVEDVPSGTVTRPVRGPGGWYVLKATSLTPARTLSFAAVDKLVLSQLTDQLRFKALDRWLDAARARATVTKP